MYNIGNIVNTRGRDWVVQPSGDKDLILLKPLDGGEEESLAIYKELFFERNEITNSSFNLPSLEDIGTYNHGKILYNATRLSFRDSSAPFRSIAKLSFRPRAYQMVPLIMALKQYKKGKVRLLIADDVGVGKTIEALLILKEMLERKQIKRFAIIVLPHLAEQWQEELKSKFNIDAVIIKSNSMAKLDREVYGDTSVYQHYPYQIISIDLVKSEKRRNEFLQDAPEFIIVDEAHTASSIGDKKQQRNNLIKELSKDEERSLLLLTATPHSGKQKQFQSLLQLLNKDFFDMDILSNRTRLAKYYIQRRRIDVKKWMDEDTPFPERESNEVSYPLGSKYNAFYKKLVKFTLKVTDNKINSDKKNKNTRFRYWTALALLRGIMSSPNAGVEMLKNREDKYSKNIDDDLNLYNQNHENNPLIENDYDNIDYEPIGIIKKVDWNKREKLKLKELKEELSLLKGKKEDFKLKEAISILTKWKKEGYNPVVFCRYINTAKYLGEYLKKEKEFKHVNIEVITSELPNELRKEKISEMSTEKPRILIATDCLSEGINLQEQFDSILHYDLPWNPNRLEQREGRIDRFGQKRKKVKVSILYSNENPIDKTVMTVLFRKIKEIKKSIGITIPFAENNKELLDTLLEAVIKDKGSYHRKLKPLAFENYQESSKITNELNRIAKEEKETRSIFAQNTIKANEIEKDLKDVDEAIGDPDDVRIFTINALRLLNGQIEKSKDKKGYLLFLDTVDKDLRVYLPQNIYNKKDNKENILKVTFYSPAEIGYYYLGRNHPFIENLSNKILNDFVITKETKGRVSVINSIEVKKKTTLLLFRVRNITRDIKRDNKFLSEEAIIMGFEGNDIKNVIDDARVKELFQKVKSDKAISDFKKELEFNKVFEIIKENMEKHGFDNIAKKRNEKLVEVYERFYNVLDKGKSNTAHYKMVEPVMPMDLISIYLILPYS